MWKEFINGISDTCKFEQPVSEKEILVTENELNFKLPSDLKNLLYETNGVKGDYALDLIWSLERIKKDNLSFRSSNDFKELYMPFDSLLFFGDAGNGDQFAFTILNGTSSKDDIFVWNHEDDSRMWIAPSLKIFIEWWLNGTISI